MLTPLAKRRILIVEFNPHQILVARIARPNRGPLILESNAEFERSDDAGLGAWLDVHGAGRKGTVSILCGVVPKQGFMLRENVQTRRLEEPEYLSDMVQEQQKGRFLTATPFKVQSSQSWTLRALNAIDGSALPPDGSTRPALIAGVTNDEAVAVHDKLAAFRLAPDRLEAGLVSLFGAVYGVMERRGDQRAVVVIVIHQSATAVYILGKKGVHTPNPVLHGLDSVVELARKQSDAPDDATVRSQLHSSDRAMLGDSAKLVWRIGRDLKPVIDSYEMATGQPAEEILCANLPPQLKWIAEPLALVAGRTPFTLDCAQWLPTVGIKPAESVAPLGMHWLGALSLAAHLPDDASHRAKRDANADPAYHRPWHVDCRPAESLSARVSAGRRFLAGTIAAALLIFGLAATGWQLYVTQTLRADTRYWEQQMAQSRKLFDDLTAATGAVKNQSAVLDRAVELMGPSYQLSEFIINLGRTVPPRMRVDRIETNDARIAISGAVLEPAEEASRTLGRYMDELRRHSTIGPFFSSIGITSLQRKTDSDAVTFEITLRLQRSTP